MKYVLLSLAFLCAACSRGVEKDAPAAAPAAPVSARAVSASVPKGWMEDFSAARKKAAAEGKFIFMVFSGSDWCHWCVRMDEETYAKAAFAEGAARDFVLVMIDNPRDENRLSQMARTQNPLLTSRFGIRGFPTAIVVTPEGEEVKRFSGYRPGGPAALLAFLKDALKDVPRPERKK